MKKILVRLLALSLVGLFAGQASAEDRKWTDIVEIGGEVRVRSESNLNYNNNGPAGGAFAYPDTTGNSSFVLLRTRLHLDAKPHDNVRIFVQLQDSRAWGMVGTTANNNAGGFGVHQAYLDLLDIGGSIVSVRIGRQELAYGKQRLIGSFGWSNTGRSFDAVRVRFNWEDRIISDWFASIVSRQAGADQYFFGTYNTFKDLPFGAIDAYFLARIDGDMSPAGTAYRVYTGGMRVYGKFDSGLDYDVEGAIQFGTSAPNSIFAGAGHASVGYTWDTAIKPRFGLEYNYASGDSDGTGKVTVFDNLYPTNHGKYGYMDFFSWKNLHDISANLTMVPIEKTKLGLAYHWFLVPESTDSTYRASQAAYRTGAAGVSSSGGHEVDLYFKYAPIKYFDLLAGYSVFIPGQFFKDTAVTNPIAHFLYLQLTGRF